MPRYALVRPDNTIDRLRSDVDPNVPTKAGFRWLACPEGAQPSIDRTTEAMTGPSYSVGANEVTETWGKRNLTAQEISDLKDAAVAEINGSAFAPLFKLLFNLNNRVRTLESQPTLTPAQFRAAIKALL